MKKLFVKKDDISFRILFPALVLNLLKDILERSKKSFNKFRTSAKKNRLEKNYFFVFIILNASCAVYPLSYDYALYTAQKGDIKSAEEQLRNIVINSPDNADVLYDAGVLTHQMKNFNQAVAYFARAAEYTHDDNLRFRAYFNAGNASVDNKDLKAALEYYDKALVIDKDNEYARNNRDRVKQMLEEQNKQQNQQDNNQEKEQQDQQKDEQDQQSQDKNDQEQKDNNDQQQNDQNSDQQENKGGSGKSNQQSQGNQGNEPKEGDDTKEGNQQGNKEKDHHNPANNQKGNSEQKFNEKPEGADKERDKQQGKEHERSPERKKTQNNEDKNSISSSDKQEQGKDGLAPKNVGVDQAENANEQSEETKEAHDMQNINQKINDPWLLNILNDQELNDKATNKKLMEAKIRQHGGKNVQNCW